MNTYDSYKNISSQENSENEEYIINLKKNNVIPTKTDKCNLNIIEENKLNIKDINFNKKENLPKNNIYFKANNDISKLKKMSKI